MRLGKLALITDAWTPQTNGVVNTLSRLVAHLRAHGVSVDVLSPAGHRTAPLPSYREVRVATDPWLVIPRLRAARPDAVHIATEGPLGVAARLWLRRRGYPFTTSYHTRFPEYVAARGLLPLAWGYRFERWFHGAAERTLVGTRSLIAELRSEGVGRALVHWPRGVDAELFSPERANASLAPAPRPVWLSVGRIAVEKSLADFLALDLPGTKVVVGDGPDRAELERRFPEARFLGYRFGPDLASLYASADCFVFPSRTETFGNVILEALASGLPVAATSAPGPVDLIEEGVNGSVQTPLLEACWAALRCSRAAARRSALRYSWEASHERFVSHLAPIPARPDAPSFTSAGAAAVPS